ncbi:aminoacyl-tRNA hydrolase [Sulfuriflexus mobilis]|uniref:aminoacyl-tRNA hydrolase n=1 Tax=Sulfuriflexus mobilis TaxID=1811807 RepID=UPI000F835175|nr:aminoacyl-tRNA hydrolase [Sulfuriflexus mobilis]
MSRITLIVGLGNPGTEYEATRHNAGFWFIDELARQAGVELRKDTKFHGLVGKADLHGNTVWLLKPDTFMNRSGQSVSALASYYKIPVEEILVAHDELDFDPGVVKLKRGGGHAGHNGLRDIISAMGSKEFLRLRIGIGHPGNAKQVSDFVLTRPSNADRQAIDDAVYEAQRIMSALLDGDVEKAMRELH